MKFSCNQDTLAKHLNILSRIVQSKPGLPILNNILVQVGKNKVSMTSTDLEISLDCWIGAKVTDEGEITIPAKQLAEFINSVPQEKIDITLNNNIVTIETDGNTAEFNTIAPDDFPSTPTISSKEKPLLKMLRKDLVNCVEKVSFASAKDDIKPVLTGILLEIEDKEINFVATDGLRLSKQSSQLEAKIEDNISLLAPTKGLEELAKIVTEFEDGEEYIEIYHMKNKNQIVFKYGDIKMASRLIDGEFPEYKQIIPTGFQTKCEFKKSVLSNSLKVANIIARNILGNKIEINIDTEKKKIALSAAQAEIGQNKSEFSINAEGESLKIAFSGKFLGELLNNIDNQDIIFQCASPTSPGVFKIKDDSSFIHLIMPMRI